MDSKYELLLPKDTHIKAGFLSHLFFAWMNGLLRLGHQRRLNDDELFQLLDENKAEYLVNDLYELWTEEVRNAKEVGKKPRLWKAMWKLFPRDFILVTVIKFMEYTMLFVLAISLWYYLRFMEDTSNVDKTCAIPAVTCIGIASLIKVFCYHHSDYLFLSMGMRMKIAVIGIIHKNVCEK
jgi:hypothetical protein